MLCQSITSLNDWISTPTLLCCSGLYQKTVKELVSKSVVKRRFTGVLIKWFTKFFCFVIFIAGLREVIIYSSPDDKKKNRWIKLDKRFYQYFTECQFHSLIPSGSFQILIKIGLRLIVSIIQKKNTFHHAIGINLFSYDGRFSQYLKVFYLYSLKKKLSVKLIIS